MKIAILQGAFLPVPPELGGAVEKLWFLLGQKFAERGHHVTHISRRWKTFPDRDLIRGVEHIRSGGFDTPKSMLALKILDGLYTLGATALIPRDADIIVTNTFLAPMTVPLLRRGNVYVDVARMPKGQMRFYRRAVRLRANSTPVAEAIRAEIPEKRWGQVGLIPNPLPFDVPADMDLAEKEPVILYCGRVHPEKGLSLLNQAVARLPAGWSIYIVGPSEVRAGGGGPEYLASLKDSLSNPAVHFLGPIYDSEKLNQLYRRASVFVYPSVAETGETFGLAPLEAMAWGCVPVVSDLTCFKDFIADQKNGVIFNHRAADAGARLCAALLGLIGNSERRAQLSKWALMVRSTHSADRIADLFLADFEKMLE